MRSVRRKLSLIVHVLDFNFPLQESAWPGYEEIPLVEALNGTIKPDNIPEGIMIIFVCNAFEPQYQNQTYCIITNCHFAKA